MKTDFRLILLFKGGREEARRKTLTRTKTRKIYTLSPDACPLEIIFMETVMSNEERKIDRSVA